MVPHKMKYAYAIILLVAYLLSPTVNARTSVVMQVPSNVAVAGGSYITKGATTFSGASFNSALTTTVNGTPFTAPAVWRLAANAPQFAVAMVRVNPTSLAVGAVATWLSSGGIQWIEGQFQKIDPNLCLTACIEYGANVPNGEVKWGKTRSAALAAVRAYVDQLYGPGYGIYTEKDANSYTARFGGVYGTLQTYNYATRSRQPDTPGYLPVTDPDWQTLAANPLPDPVAGQLAPHGLPLQKPAYSLSPMNVPLGSPYYNPATGQWFQPMMTITPDPNSLTWPGVATNQQVDPDGNPAVDPGTGAPKLPDPEPDPCTIAPDSLACVRLGMPVDEPGLPEKSTGPSSITPIALATSMSCPSPITLPKNMGVVKYDMACDLAGYIRPLALVFAWLSAALIVSGAFRDA